jgi:hypothetical protein
MPSRLNESEIWFRDPKFLTLPESNWPVCDQIKDIVNIPEVKVPILNAIKTEKCFIFDQ